jgi:hypothetical protein
LNGPVFPCVTFHISTTSPDIRFEDASPARPSAPIDNARLDIEIWAGPQRNDVLVSTVAGRIESLFRNCSYALAAGSGIDGGTGANVFRFQQVASQVDLGPDSVLKWHWGVVSYLARIQR